MSVYDDKVERSSTAKVVSLELEKTETTVIDAKGLKCPEPVMLLHNAIRKAPPEALILLVATDQSTRRDVPQFCQFLEHQLLENSEDEATGTYSFLIKKQMS